MCVIHKVSINLSSILLLSLSFFSIDSNAELPKFLSWPMEEQHIVGNGWDYGFEYDNGESHGSVDLVAPFRSNVIAAADGWAVYDKEGAGNIVIIKHKEVNERGEHLYTLYGHLDEVASGIPYKYRQNVSDESNISAWKKVKRGEYIGKSGQSEGKKDAIGRRWGQWPHIHFNVFAGSYGNACYPTVNFYRCKNSGNIGVRAFDPYDLYKDSESNISSSKYYPPIIYKDKKEYSEILVGYKSDYNFENDIKYTGWGERESGEFYSGSGSRRLWISDPPFPPIVVVKRSLINISSPSYDVYGIGFSLPKDGSARLRSCSSPSSVQGTSCDVINISSSEIAYDSGRLSFDVPIPFMGKPFLLELFRSDDKKIGEMSYPFVDIAPESWFALSANKFFIQGFIEGYKDSANLRFFKPESSISRAEFLKLLVKFGSLGCKNIVSNSFSDVSVGDWFLEYVDIAVCNGLLNSNDKFRPNDEILRGEAVSLIVKVKGVQSLYKDNCVSIFASEFSDVNKDDWFHRDACVSRNAGWVAGYSNPEICKPDLTPCLKPLKSITRAEAVVFLDKVFQQ